jgi:hypothetical protein
VNRQQLAAMTQTLTVAVPRQNAEAARALLVRTAEAERRRVLTEQTSRAGIAPTLATVVDGRRNADPASVQPDGYILLEWGYVREVATAALEALRAAALRASGDWERSLVALADGVKVEPAAIPHEAREVLIVAPTPYARRLEIGRTKRGDPFVLDDQDYRLLERTHQRLRRVYRRVAQIDFTYVALESAYQLSSRTARAGAGGGHVRNPAIRIRGWQVA